jgi:hypothetical protein
MYNVKEVLSGRNIEKGTAASPGFFLSSTSGNISYIFLHLKSMFASKVQFWTISVPYYQTMFFKWPKTQNSLDKLKEGKITRKFSFTSIRRDFIYYTVKISLIMLKIILELPCKVVQLLCNLFKNLK